MSDMMSLEWHQQNLENIKSSIKFELERLCNGTERGVDEIKKEMASYNFYKLQLETAVKQKKDGGFDRENFMSSERPKFEPNKKMAIKLFSELFFDECHAENCQGGCIEKFMDGKLCFERRRI